jgi:glutaredoxin
MWVIDGTLDRHRDFDRELRDLDDGQGEGRAEIKFANRSQWDLAVWIARSTIDVMLERRRCAWHGLIVDDHGMCTRCRNDAERRNARTIYALVAAGAVAMLLVVAAWKVVFVGAELQAARARELAQRNERRNDTASGVPSASNEVSVIVYTADYCGWCRKTKGWLDERGIAYTERRIDTDPSARREMQAKFRGGGIPAIDIEGERRQGFDPAWLDRTIRARAAMRRGPS